MRMICGVLRPDSGTITLGKTDVSSENYRAVLGYLPQDFGYYPSFTAMDFLLYMAATAKDFSGKGKPGFVPVSSSRSSGLTDTKKRRSEPSPEA